MPQKLSERPERLLRQFLTDSIRPNEVQGYDPQQTDTTANDFLPVITDWSERGDYYPIISITETEGPTVPNGGESGYQSVRGDGTGPNQYIIYNITLSCQAVELEGSSAYLNGTSPEDLVDDLFQECHHQIQNNATTAISEAAFISLTPATQTRSSDQTDSGSTLEWIQRQSTAQMGVLNTP